MSDATRDGLGRLIQEKYNGSPEYIADAILASDWLSAHVAAAVAGRDAEIERLRSGVTGLLGEWAIVHDRDCASNAEFGPEPCDCWQADLRAVFAPVSGAVEAAEDVETFASRTSSRDWPAEVQTVMDGIARRLAWPSMHWGTEDVHPDAWPHIAAAALDSMPATAPVAVHEQEVRAIEEVQEGDPQDWYFRYKATPVAERERVTDRG